MSDTKKTKAQLIQENKELRAKISQLELNETDHKQMVVELQNTKAAYNAFFNNSPAGMAIWDSNFRYQHINEVLQKLNGPSMQDHIGKTVGEVLPKAESIILPLFKEILSSKKAFLNLELSGEVPSNPNEIRHYIASYFPIEDSDQKATSIGGIVLDITNRKESENRIADLLEREKVQSEILKEAPMAFAFAYPDGRLENCNLAFSKLTGYSLAELKEINWNEVLTPAKWNDHESNILKQLTSKNKVVTYEKEYVHKNGTIIPIELTVTGKFIEGELIHFQGFVKDITDRKKAEKDLLNSEEKFRTMVTNSEEIIYMIDKDGIFLLSEGKGLSKIGVKPGQVVGASVYELYADYPEMLNEMQKAFSGESVSIEHKVEGQYFKSWYTPQLGDKDEVIALLGLSVNITKNKQLEEQLQRSKEQMDLALGGANAGLWSWNIKTGEDLFDERWCGILGYKIEELPHVVDTWEKLLHPDDKERVMGIVTKHFENNEEEFRAEYRMKCKNGDWKWILASGKVVERDPEGNPARMTGIITDIDSQKEVEEELKKHRENLEKLVRERTSELEKKNKELDNAVKVFVGRELTIRNLQATIQKLKDSEKSKSR